MERGNVEDNPTPRRFKVLFPDADQFYAAQAFQSPNSEILVRDFNRNFISVGLPSDPQGSPGMERELDRDLRRFKETYGATIAEDYQYCLEGNALVPEIFAPAQLEPANAAAPSLDDVLDLIHAPEAWAASNRGAGIDIAVVDTGIDGSR